jgi:phosphate transport system permease protein
LMPLRRRLTNSAARILISFGGLGVILVVTAIFIFISYITLPLWQSPEISLLHTHSRPDSVRAPKYVIGSDEYQQVAYAASTSGEVVTFDLETGKTRTITRVHPLAGTDRLADVAVDPSKNLIGFASTSGEISAYHIIFHGNQEDVTASVEKVFSARHPRLIQIDRLHVKQLPSSAAVALMLGQGEGGRAEIGLLRYERKINRFTGAITESTSSGHVVPSQSGSITSFALDGFGQRLVLGYSSGIMEYWSLAADASPVLIQSVVVSSSGSAISFLCFLLGDQSIIVGMNDGSVRTWTWISDETSASGWQLRELNVFENHRSPITVISFSPRNKAFATADASGVVKIHHQTTSRTVAQFSVGSSPVQAATFSPKADAILTVDSAHQFKVTGLSFPHVEVSLGMLFSKVHYEGYDKPAYMWQSSSGTDDTEPKLSLMPLLFGTLKGAFYALLFAFPVAILAAIYTALFAHPTIRNVIKPTVEIMAALPSVVIGFIAALWLAPLLETMLAEVLIIVLAIPIVVLLAALSWRALPRSILKRLKDGSELVAILAAIVVLGYVVVQLGPSLELFVFGGTLRQWLVESLGIVYDQRNSVVVGFAMGFAVIPIIFTISEDALSGVPEHLTAGSLALGATRWQTAVRVILPTASPGIFSAAMIGFGRAVGETMIVLMATGNTPLMDWSPFVGMRTLSANIAVELPEAPYLGTLYRVLFFSGLLLFFFTFAVNTAAEVVRHRLRKRYSTI